jgi:restriction endonuclease S subunit
MITSEIKFSQMEDRMDATFYKPEYITASNLLESLKATSSFRLVDFKELTKEVRKGIFYILKEDYIDKGIPFIRVSNINDVFLNGSDLVYISERKNREEIKTCLSDGDLVVSKSGTVGNVSIVTKDFVPCNISQDVIGIKLREGVSPYYICIFFWTKIGSKILERGKSLAVQSHLTLDYLRDLKIPIPPPLFQSRIESLVKTAYEKRKEAQRKLQEAEEILERKLGWKELELNHDKAFETSFSHLERRLDPEYFKPRYERIKEVLLSKDAKPLSEAVKVITKRADFRKTPDKIINYVAIADINPESSQIISHTEMPAYQAPSRATYEIREGQILTAVSGVSRDSKKQISCYVTKKQNNYICTNGFAVLEPKENIEPLYLTFYLKSPFYTEQLVRELTGATIPAISLEDMKQVLVYLPSIKIQKEIAKLMEMSNYLRIESRDLIEQAKREVEEMIEKGKKS